MAKSRSYAEVKALAKTLGVLRPKDLSARGIPRAVLSRLCAKGQLTKTGRGLYVLSVADLTENHSLAEVARLVPRGIICLLSALRFHELTTQLPSEVWLAIPPNAHRPRGGSYSLVLALVEPLGLRLETLQ